MKKIYFFHINSVPSTIKICLIILGLGILIIYAPNDFNNFLLTKIFKNVTLTKFSNVCIKPPNGT